MIWKKLGGGEISNRGPPLWSRLATPLAKSPSFSNNIQENKFQSPISP